MPPTPTGPTPTQKNIDDSHYIEVAHARYAAYDEYLRTGELAALNAWVAADREYIRLQDARQRAKAGQS